MAKKFEIPAGRGLTDILDDVEKKANEDVKSGKREILEIDIEKIEPNPYQPRKNFDKEALAELSQSIQRHGLIQPVVVIQKQDDKYILIVGERRFRATKLLGEKKIRAIVVDIGSRNLRELALIENIQRENLNPIELANSYKELIDEYKTTQEDLANLIKKSRVQVTNTLRLLTLEDDVKQSIIDGKLTQGHAKILVGLDKKDQKVILDTILGQKLSVRETENLVKKIKDNKNTNLKIKKVEDFTNFKNELLKIKTKLSSFGKIKIKDKKFSIEFSSIEQIQKFIEKIK